MEPLVVYIIGDNRSGTTLLDYLLSCHPDAVSVGELHHLWGYYYKKGVGKMYDWKCSCGEPLKSCEFWSTIIQRIPFSATFETRLNVKLSKGAFLSYKGQNKNIENIIEDQIILKKAREIAENNWEIYKAIGNYREKPIIIDSSKNVFEAFFLHKYRRGNIRFLLMDRNICEVAYSKMNREKELKSIYNRKENSIFKHIIGTYRVSIINSLVVDKIKEYANENIVKKVNYVSLAENSKREIKEICSFLDIDDFEAPLSTGQYSTTPHVLGGSPSRYKNRPIQPDIRWKTYYKSNLIARVFGNLLQSLCK